MPSPARMRVHNADGSGYFTELSFGDVLAFHSITPMPDKRRWMYLCHEMGNPNGGTYLSLDTGNTMHWTDGMISDNFYLADEPS